MIKSFKEELRLIRYNKRFHEKPMIIAIYNEFYNDILESLDKNSGENFAHVMEKAFEVTVEHFNSNNNINVNAERFMRMYFRILKSAKISKTQPISQIIYNFENQLYNYKETMKFVDVVDKFDELSLDSKVNIILQFREYANDLLNTISGLFGFENTIQLRTSLLKNLTIKFGEYLNNCRMKKVAPLEIAEGVKHAMMEVAKNHLILMLNKGEFNFQMISEENLYEFFNNFNNLEQNIWLLNFIYEIAGYNKSVKVLDSKKINEICRLLGISKLRYSLTNISMGLKSLSAFNTLNSNNASNGNKR